jgi:hypothetical protein
MDGALTQLSTYVKPDRLYVLETDGITVSNTFEWCAEGIQPEIDTLQNRNYDEYIGGWEEFLKHDTSVVIPDIELLKEHDPIDYYNLKRQGIERLLCSPFYSEGRIVGYLGADNYEVSDLVNTKAIWNRCRTSSARRSPTTIWSRSSNTSAATTTSPGSETARPFPNRWNCSPT